MTTETAEKLTSTSIDRSVWRRLNELRQDPKEKFNDVIRRLLDEREAAGKAAHGAQERP